MTQSTPQSPLAVVLVAHGSRDPAWAAPVQALATRLRPRVGWVRCAYLELMPPTVPEVMAELAQLGAREVRVVPLFFGLGQHARQGLPALLQAARERHTTLRIESLPSLGEQSEVLDLMAQRVLGDV